MGRQYDDLYINNVHDKEKENIPKKTQENISKNADTLCCGPGFIKDDVTWITGISGQYMYMPQLGEYTDGPLSNKDFPQS